MFLKMVKISNASGYLTHEEFKYYINTLINIMQVRHTIHKSSPISMYLLESKVKISDKGIEKKSEILHLSKT